MERMVLIHCAVGKTKCDLRGYISSEVTLPSAQSRIFQVESDDCGLGLTKRRSQKKIFINERSAILVAFSNLPPSILIYPLIWKTHSLGETKVRVSTSAEQIGPARLLASKMKGKAADNQDECHCYKINTSWSANPLNPDISLPILHTVLHTFPMLLRRRICLTVNTFST